MALLAFGSLAAVAGAQEERPQITPGERKVPRKKDVGPRALGLVRLSANGKATLVPITILLDGKFYDASAYKASPVPMALDSGTVYEGEHTGTSLGLFTVSGALHSTTANSQTPWIGTGAWLPAGTEVKKTTLKAEDVPVGIDTSDEPPRLSKSGGAPKDAPSAGSPPPATESKAGAQDDDRPKLSRPQSDQTKSDQAKPDQTKSDPAKPEQTKSDQAKPDQAKPDQAKPDQAKPDQPKPDQPKEPDSNSGAGDANRPKLRRGKPVEALPDEEIPGYSKPGATPSSAPATSAGKPADTTTSTLVAPKLIPAISDATGPEPRSFTFEWLKTEEGERREQMMAFAKEQLRAYLDALAKAKITSKPAGPQAARRKSKSAEPIIENAQMVAYDLWTTNQPVIVFAADAHMPPPPAGTPHSATDTDLQYSMMLVARTDIYNNLHKLYVGITDKYHLDITPRLELIDAVDVDGDGRGELLFRETSDAGTGWVIYRASADKLWKMFDSLNPE